MSIVIGTKNNSPLFADIKYNSKIYELVYFIVTELCTCYFDEHIQAYILRETNTWLLTQQHNLKTHETLYSQCIDVPIIEDDNIGHANSGRTIKLEKKK